MTHTSQESVEPGRRNFLRAAALLVGGGALGGAAISRVLDAQGAPAQGAPAQGAPAQGEPAQLRPAQAKAAQATAAQATAAQPQMVVYKDPNCGCCKLWVDHVRKAGFTVDVKETSDMDAVKTSMGLPAGLASCHTARVGNYLIEGHVPADLVQKLLREKPANARGLAVPGMPVGSPGMEMGDRKDPYDVLLFDKAGKTTVYAKR